ncbi:MAG: type IV pilus biogenesis/stability protein PilW [Luteibacter sp.]|nr:MULTISPECIES: type IV pilus biogenesis/stability protein PilW [Rhodanobacteraceae]MDQ7995098.1 type IV pilus biogenesis/stability protein PilW [Luteibacter sp.]MDQ8047387.1 type IV pilus biogenesis/stability protein PilW [Luteibacter sp.]SDF47002.1 type IV pilus assembly protein PilF [Dyella sp. 333MFSha]SKB26126.1 type IV pilus assembly protein PilF [Luteibacter sp. 22Crub2.1]
MRLERWGMLVALVWACTGCVGDGSVLKPATAADERAKGAQVHTELGQRYMESGNLQGAMEKLQKALSFDPRYVPAHTVIAVLYERINDPVNAELHYRKAIEFDPKKGSLNNNLAVFLCKQGRAGEAKPFFDRALADPFYETPDLAMTNAGTCQIQAHDYEAAEGYFRKALERNGNNADALYQMAYLLYLKNDAFRARAFMQRYEALARPTPDSLKLGRDIELRLGNGEVAQDYAKRLRSQFPDSEQARSLEASARQ